NAGTLTLSLSGKVNPAITNTGTLNKTTSATITIRGLTNSGTLNLQAGGLNLEAGDSSGAFHVSSGATLTFAVLSYTLDSTAVLDGAGQVVVGGGTVTF